MAEYRVVERDKLYFVQKKVGVIRRRWVDVDRHGQPLVWDESLNPTAIFSRQVEAVDFMNGIGLIERTEHVVATRKT